MYFKRDMEYKIGTFYAGGGENELPADDSFGAIRALDAATGALRWEFRLHSPPWAGVLSTAGGLVFSGSDEGNFYALNDQTGKALWDFQTGVRSGQTRSPSPWTDTSGLPSAPIACCMFSDSEQSRSGPACC